MKKLIVVVLILVIVVLYFMKKQNQSARMMNESTSPVPSTAVSQSVSTNEDNVDDLDSSFNQVSADDTSDDSDLSL